MAVALNGVPINVLADVGCDACFDELDRYVELDLAGENADAALPGLRVHLDGPACREEHDSLYAFARGAGSTWT